jgi:hypothetical protein
MTPQSVSFANDIRRLFQESDRDAMEAWFDLWALEDVRSQAGLILQRLDDGSMPCDEPWPAESVALFRQWVEAECPE